MAAAAEMILEQDKMEFSDKEDEEEDDEDDEDDDDEEEEDEEEEEECLTDSGYGGPDTSPESSDQK